jgi:hypothetical protein
MNLAQLEDLLLRLKRLSADSQLRADVESRGSSLNNAVYLNRLYELPIALREASEVVEEVVVARRRREVGR